MLENRIELDNIQKEYVEFQMREAMKNIMKRKI
jgi:hypothetical protein